VYLIQILLPLTDNDGRRFDGAILDRTREEMIDEFGGVTAFFRSPAAGAWETPDGAVHRDSIVVLEVMAEHLDRGWWRDYRAKLERRFSQESIVARASKAELL
jgi:hypothetical protein